MSNEKPILFKDDMIRAILEGRKTQTRRIIKPQPELTTGSGFAWNGWLYGQGSTHAETVRNFAKNTCPYGKAGDRLWVREAHAFVPMPAYRCSAGIYQQINPSDDYEACVYRENFDRARSFPWRPSVHMPRWASRITLEITDVRVERLQDISIDDAKAEGGPTHGHSGAEISPRKGFRHLWGRINGHESWDANPWVWVIEFKRIDQEAKAA